MANYTYVRELDWINNGILKDSTHLYNLHDKVLLAPYPASVTWSVLRVK